MKTKFRRIESKVPVNFNGMSVTVDADLEQDSLGTILARANAVASRASAGQPAEPDWLAIDNVMVRLRGRLTTLQDTEERLVGQLDLDWKPGDELAFLDASTFNYATNTEEK